jgi:copper transport protein
VSGIYEVAWETTSADDGHIAQGSFAFAVGSVGGQIPSPTTLSPAPNSVTVLTNWVFFIGLAFSAGALLTMLVDQGVSGRTQSMRLGFLVGVVAATWNVLAILTRKGGIGSTPQRVLDLTLMAAVLLALGAVLSVTRRGIWPALIVVVGAAGAWAGLGHGAARDGTLGWVAATIHLLAAAFWLGALYHLVVQVFAARRTGGDVMAITRRYARMAPFLVLAVASSGVFLATALLPKWSSILTTGYGQILIFKTTLLLAAVSLALVARRPGISRQQTGPLRRVTPIEGAILATILAAASLLVEVGPPVAGLSISNVLGASALAGPTLDQAGLAGYLTVGVTSNGHVVQFEVYAGNAQLAGTTIHVQAALAKQAGWHTIALSGCGPGCASGPLVLPSGTTRLSVSTTAPGWHGGTLDTSLAWPPPPTDPALLTKLVATMRSIPALHVTEVVRSGRYHSAPRTVALTGAQFMKGEVYVGPEADEPVATSAQNVQPLPNGHSGMSFDLGQGHLWATIWVDRAGRMVRERLINAGDEINRTFTYP